jgi:hypothetical protein
MEKRTILPKCPKRSISWCRVLLDLPQLTGAVQQSSIINHCPENESSIAYNIIDRQ